MKRFRALFVLLAMLATMIGAPVRPTHAAGTDFLGFDPIFTLPQFVSLGVPQTVKVFVSTVYPPQISQIDPAAAQNDCLIQLKVISPPAFPFTSVPIQADTFLQPSGEVSFQVTFTQLGNNNTLTAFPVNPNTAACPLNISTDPQREPTVIFNVVPPGPQTAFITQPSNTEPNQPISPPVRVAAEINGRVDPTYNNFITVGIYCSQNNGCSGTPGAVIGGTTTVRAVNGIATFNNLTIDRYGLGYRLTATGFTGVLPGPLNVFFSQPFDVPNVVCANYSSGVVNGVNYFTYCDNTGTGTVSTVPARFQHGNEHGLLVVDPDGQFGVAEFRDMWSLWYGAGYYVNYFILSEGPIQVISPTTFVYKVNHYLVCQSSPNNGNNCQTVYRPISVAVTGPGPFGGPGPVRVDELVGGTANNPLWTLTVTGLQLLPINHL